MGLAELTHGSPKQKKIMIGAAGAAALYVGYRWYQSRSGGSAPVAVPGDATAAAAGSAGGPYVNPDPNAGATYDSGSASGSAPSTDQQWTAAVVQDLGNLGYDQQTVAEALAAYLNSQQLTTIQATIVRLAWSWEGRPPQHPSLPINTAPSTGTPPPTGGGGTTTPPPTGGGGTTTPPPTKTPPKHVYPERKTYHVTVAKDTYTRLAASYGTKISGQQLYEYQFTPQAGRSAAAQKELRAQGANVLHVGGTTAIPYPKG